MVRSKTFVALCAASGLEACLAEPVRQQDVDADALSLLQTKAVVSRRAQEESYSKTDTENEWGLGGMFSSVVEAVHGAFQHESNPVDDKHALQLMEAEKTVVNANNTAHGVLHLVHGCHQCGFHFCDKASIKESKTGIEDSYLVGSDLSEWGCDKVANPYVVHDKKTRKVYAVEFLETQPKEESASKEDISKAKASKVEVKNSFKSEVEGRSHSELKDKSIHKETESKTAGKTVATKAEKSAVAAGADSTSKPKWPDFSLPHLEAADKIKEKIIATVHKDDIKVKQLSQKSMPSKTEKAEASKDSKLDDSHSAGNKKEKKEEISSVKSMKLDEHAPTAKQHPHASSLMEHHVVMTEKEDLPDLKMPHAIRKAVESVEEKISSTLSEGKKSEIKGKSTTHVSSKLAANSKESKEEKKDERASAESVKSDKHEASTSPHPHDSSFLEHGVVMAEKEDLPTLKIPHVIRKAVETAQEKLSSKVSEDKKSEIKDESTTRVKDSKLAAGKHKEEEKKDKHSDKAKATASTSTSKGHAAK